MRIMPHTYNKASSRVEGCLKCDAAAGEGNEHIQNTQEVRQRTLSYVQLVSESLRTPYLEGKKVDANEVTLA